MTRSNVQSVSKLPTYKVRRSAYNNVTIAAVDQGGVISLSPSTFTNWSEISAIYDLYRFRRVEVKFVCWRAASPSLTSDSYPTLMTAVDWNDGTGPSVFTDLLEYGNCQVEQFAEGDKRTLVYTFVPKLQFNTSATNTILADENAWARTGSTDTWYGLKYWLKNYNSTTYNNTVVDVYVTADIEFKLSK